MNKNLISQISIHFDGPIAVDHSVQLRTLSKALDNIQNSIDRAYLDIKYGKIWKNATLKKEDYLPTDFVMRQTREGGFITDLIGGAGSEKIVQRIYRALLPAYEKAKNNAVIEHEKLVELAEKRIEGLRNGLQVPKDYKEIMDKPDALQTTAFGDRSIVKEFDQIASAIRARDGDGSVIEFDFYAEKALPTLIFDEKVARNFHGVVSTRTLGDPVKIPIKLRALDSGRGVSKAKALNIISDKEFNLHIYTDRGFSSLRKYLKKRNPPIFEIVACPILEYEAFDPLAGDMYFISVVS